MMRVEIVNSHESTDQWHFQYEGAPGCWISNWTTSASQKHHLEDDKTVSGWCVKHPFHGMFDKPVEHGMILCPLNALVLGLKWRMVHVHSMSNFLSSNCSNITWKLVLKNEIVGRPTKWWCCWRKYLGNHVWGRLMLSPLLFGRGSSYNEFDLEQ